MEFLGPGVHVLDCEREYVRCEVAKGTPRPDIAVALKRGLRTVDNIIYKLRKDGDLPRPVHIKKQRQHPHRRSSHECADAARMQASGMTYGQIADALGTSRGKVAGLIRDHRRAEASRAAQASAD